MFLILYNKLKSYTTPSFERSFILNRLDRENEHSSSECVSPPPYRKPDPQPYRYGMALTGFILGTFSVWVPLIAWILLVTDENTGGLGALTTITILLLPVAFACSIVGLTLSFIAVPSSRGAKFALTGICLNALAMPVSGAFGLISSVVLFSP